MKAHLVVECTLAVCVVAASAAAQTPVADLTATGPVQSTLTGITSSQAPGPGTDGPQASPPGEQGKPPEKEEPDAGGDGWNVWKTRPINTTMIITIGADVGGFLQDEPNRGQVGDQPTLVKWRAERINFGGTLNFKRPWVWQVGGNFNGLEADAGDRWTWMDVRLDVPLWSGGRVRVGRQKVGGGMEWELPLTDWAFMERSGSSSAFVPQRNVGVILTSTFAKERGMWSAGWFNDWFAKDNSFSGNGNQYSARLTLLPVDSGPSGDTVVEVGTAVFYKEATNGKLQYRSRPELNQSDYFVDTGNIAADHSVTSQFETMVIRGPLQMFGEFHLTPVSSRESGNPFFYGGFAGVAYLLTGEHHGYNRLGGYQTRLTPSSPIGAGPGAWEVAGRYSYVNLSDGLVDGGVMSRWTGALSWYLSREWKVQFNYGYITLDKGGTRGHAHGVSSRIVWNM